MQQPQGKILQDTIVYEALPGQPNEGGVLPDNDEHYFIQDLKGIHIKKADKSDNLFFPVQYWTNEGGNRYKVSSPDGEDIYWTLDNEKDLVTVEFHYEKVYKVVYKRIAIAQFNYSFK